MRELNGKERMEEKRRVKECGEEVPQNIVGMGREIWERCGWGGTSGWMGDVRKGLGYGRKAVMHREEVLREATRGR
jgi:hypothetical protein